MNQENIGKYIQEKRKKEKLTQKQLAEKINVSEKTISKWECGKGLPEVSLMQPLCKELKISVNELLNGKDDQEKKDDQGYINYIKYNNKKKITKFITTIIILTIIFILGVFFINNYGKTTVYKLYGESNNFTYLDGLLIKSNDKNILVSGRILSNNEDIIKTEDILHTSLKSSGKIIIGGSFDGINIEPSGYNEIFTKEKLNNLNNWYLEITYNLNKETKTEIIIIENNLILNSNKFLPQLTLPVGNKLQNDNKIHKENSEKEIKRLENKLLNNKFISKGTSIFEKEIDNYTIKVNTKTNYVRIYNPKSKYGEDSIDIKYNCERCKNNIIELELSTEGKSYYILYDINTESLSCSDNNCPSNAWQICKNFYEYITELLTTL